MGLAGCADEHPAYDLDFSAEAIQLAQTASDAPSRPAGARVQLEVTPSVDHTRSWVTLDTTERFPDGWLRAYEPSDNARFVYDERFPLLTIPATLRAEPVRIGHDAERLRIDGQVSNLELEPLCGERVVVVVELVVWDTESGSLDERAFAADGARLVDVPVDGRIVCP